MSSLNSSDVPMLRRLLFGGKPSIAELRATGLDIELLEKVYAIIKPELNFFPRQLFSPLVNTLEPHEAKWLEVFPLMTFAERRVMVVADETVRNIDGEVISLEDDPSHCARVQVYLDKEGRWYVWMNCRGDRFDACNTPAQAMEIAHRMLPVGSDFASTESLSLSVVLRLTLSYERYVEVREMRLQESRDRRTRLRHLIDGLY